MICVDASIVVRLVLAGNPDAPVARLWSQWLTEQELLVAPDLLFYEVTNALHRYRVADLLTESACASALDAALALGVQLHAGGPLHRRARALADRFGRPATHDAHYLALAEALGAPFWTTDQRLYRAVAEELNWVHVLA